MTQKESNLPVETPPYQDIIDDLNQVAHTHYRATTAITRKMINGRWAEGWRLEDFRHVNRVKAADWLGTEHEQFLRPETLYCPKHFESYRNQKLRPTKSKNANAAIDWAVRKAQQNRAK